MGISDFLASVASNFRNHYLELAQRTTPALATRPPSSDDTASSKATSASKDTYVPSDVVPISDNDRTSESSRTRAHTRSRSKIGSREANDDNERHHDVKKGDDEHEPSRVGQTPDGTYYFQRRASLDYKLNLRFDLAAITQTVERLAEGDEAAIDQFAAAGFGFRAGFSVEGRQEIETNMIPGGESEELRVKEKNRMKMRAASQFAAQSNNFAMSAFTREAADVRRSLDVRVHDGHRRTVNKIGLRLRIDNQFSFAQAMRFNVQTRRVAEEAPDSLAPFIDTAGQVASGGSSELMGSFFDAVDSYLGKTEDALLESVTTFFEMAAEELGFSGQMVEFAREHLTQSITGFFDRVEASLDSVAARFAPSRPVVETPVTDHTEPAEFAQPTVVDEKALLAVA